MARQLTRGVRTDTGNKYIAFPRNSFLGRGRMNLAGSRDS
jgi:hypothetical protein